MRRDYNKKFNINEFSKVRHPLISSEQSRKVKFMTKNKTILIIGAKSDIAIAVAYKFASKGWDLQLTSRNCSELKLLVKDIKIRYKVNISVYELDILNFDSFEDILNSLSCLPEMHYVPLDY